jgi:hypothetical protein
MKQENKDRLAAGAFGGGALVLLLLARKLKRKTRCEVEIKTDRPIDDYAPVEPVQTCDPSPKPGVVAFRDMVLKIAKGADLGISRDCAGGGDSKHTEGRAWDWAPPDSATATGFVDCLTSADSHGNPDALARRAGIRVIIWDRRIWTASTRAWAPYTKPGGDPHTGHVHFDFSWKGANAQTSLYAILEDGTAQAEAEPSNAAPRFVELLAVRGLDKTSNHFRVRLVEIANELGLDPSLIAAVISQETGAKFAAGYYSSSNRIGLLQWSRQSIEIVGATWGQAMRMTNVQQLELVKRWFQRIGPQKLVRPVDYRLVPFSPAAIGKPFGATVYDDPGLVASNVGFDRDPKDGKITVGEVAGVFDESLAAAAARPPVQVDMDDTKHKVAQAAAVLATLAAVGCSVYLDKAAR